MKKYLVISVALTAALTGCTSMLTHKRFSDEAVVGMATTTAELESCSADNLIPEQLVLDFKSALNQLYTVSVYNEDLWSTTYQARKSGLLESPPADHADQCQEIEPALPNVISNLRVEYLKIANARQEDLLAMSQSFAQMGNSMASSQSSYSTYQSSGTVAPISSDLNPEYRKVRVYKADQCTGTVVNNVCSGTVIDTGVPKYCYGTMVNGECVGTINY